MTEAKTQNLALRRHITKHIKKSHGKNDGHLLEHVSVTSHTIQYVIYISILSILDYIA